MAREYTEQQLIKWKPEDRERLRAFCQYAQIDESEFVRDTVLAIISRPPGSPMALVFPEKIQRALMQSDLFTGMEVLQPRPWLTQDENRRALAKGAKLNAARNKMARIDKAVRRMTNGART